MEANPNWTQSLLDLFASLVATGSYQYLLTSRLTQDALENLFSQIRGRGNSHPNPVHFRHSIRLISVSQFLAVPKRSSYHVTDCDFAVSLLKPAQSLPAQVLPSQAKMSNNHEEIGSSTVDSTLELNALCYLTGWIAFKLKRQLNPCSLCVDYLVSTDSEDKSMPQAQLTVLKSYGWLTMPSKSLQDVILAAEGIFKSNQADCLNSANSLQLLLDKSSSILNRSDIPTCHNVCLEVLKKYFRLRSHIFVSGLNKSAAEEKQFGSKSAKCRTTVK
jgi:hypothetical protein